MTRTIRTLYDATRHNMFVVANCRDCKRQARFLAGDLAGMFGYGKSPYELKFKCSVCDTRNCAVTLDFSDFDHKHETVVWRPTKIKG